MTIWGNHSATQYPDFYSAQISGKSAAEVITDEAWLQDEFIPVVQKRGAAIIAARGASSAASAANGVVDSVRRLTTDTPAGDSFSMCICSDGSYGTTAGLITSLPCRVKDGKLEVVQGIDLNAYSREKIDTSVKELEDEREAVNDLGTAQFNASRAGLIGRPAGFPDAPPHTNEQCTKPILRPKY